MYIWVVVGFFFLSSFVATYKIATMQIGFVWRIEWIFYSVIRCKIEIIIRIVKFYAYRRSEWYAYLLCIHKNSTQSHTRPNGIGILFANLGLSAYSLRVSSLNMFICVPMFGARQWRIQFSTKHFRHDNHATKMWQTLLLKFSHHFSIASISFSFDDDNNWPAAILSRLAAF